MGELRARFSGASNGAVQHALQPLKAFGAVVTARGPRGGHFVGPKAATERGTSCASSGTNSTALRAAEALLGELENGGGA